MRTRLFFVLAAGVALGVFATSAPARVAIEGLIGLFPSYTVQEEYEISVGVDSLGNHRKEVRQREIRHHLNLPEHYGRLIEITQNGVNTILWFKDNEGLIRNAVLPNADTVRYRIQPFITTRYEADIVSGDDRAGR